MAPPENNQSSSHVSRLNSIYVVSCAIVWSIMLFSSMTVVRVNANNAHKENLLEVEQTAIASSAALNRIFGNIDWLSVAAQFLIRWSDFDRNYIKSELARLIERDANLNQVSLLDSAGRFIVSNLSSSVTMDLSDRDHIKPLLDDNGPDVLISDPLVGRISNKLSINVAKRIRDDSGRMTHIVVVSFAPDQLIEMLGKSRSEPCTGLALMREKVGGEIVGISPKGVHCGTTASWLGERCSGEDESNGSLRSVFASFLGSNDCLIRSKRVLDNGALGLVVWMGSEPWAGRIRGDIYVASGWLLLLAVILGGGGVALSRAVAADAEILKNRAVVEDVRRIRSVAEAALKIGELFVCIFDRAGGGLYANESAELFFVEYLPAGVVPLEWLAGPPSKNVRAGISGAREYRANLGRIKLISWTVSDAEWMGEGVKIAFGMDWTQLIEAERNLQQSLQLLIAGEMASGFSHELAQPVTAIKFELSLLQKSRSAQSVESFERISTSLLRITKVIEKLRDVSRRPIDAEQISEFNIVESLQQIKNIIEGGLRRHLVEFVFDCSASAVWCNGNAIIFEQAVLGMILYGRGAVGKRQVQINKEDSLRFKLWRELGGGSGAAVVRLEVIDQLHARLDEVLPMPQSDANGDCEIGAVDRICVNMLKSIGIGCIVKFIAHKRVIEISAAGYDTDMEVNS